MVDRAVRLLVVLSVMVGASASLAPETVGSQPPILASRARISAGGGFSRVLDDPIQVLSGDNNYFLRIDLHDPRVHPRVMLANNDNGGLQSLYGMKGRLQGYEQWAVVNGDLFSSGCPGGVNCAQGLTYIDGQRKDNWSTYGDTWLVRGNIGFDSSNSVQISVGDGQTKRHMTIAGGPRVLMGGGDPTCYGELITVGGATKTLFPASGEQFDGDATYWCSDTRPITMLGYSADGRYLYMGISKGGKTVTQRAQWLKDHGAHEILRLDSGSSSGMYHNGQFIGGTGGKSIANAFAIVMDTGSPPPQPCPAPNLRDPDNGYIAGDRTITFCWDDVGCDHDGFTFRVKTVPDMESGGETVVDTGEGDNERTVTFDSEWDDRDLYWSVRAANAPGGADWASARVFHISPNPPSISFDTANDDSFSSGRIESRDRDWIFEGTASDPEGYLDRVEFHCSGDGCGSHHSHSGLSDWTYERHGMEDQNDVYFRAFDDRGQGTSSRYLDLHIDLAAPSTNHNLVGTMGQNGWYVSPAEVRLHADDGNTGHARVGVREIHYRVDGGGWQTYGGDNKSFTVSTDGTHTVEYYAVDNVGNTESSHSVTFKIDATPPTAPGAANEAHGVVSGQWQRDWNDPAFTWGPASDATSGLRFYHVYWKDELHLTDIPSYDPPPVCTGSYELRVRAQDWAGNVGPEGPGFTFRYDGTPPMPRTSRATTA